MTLAARGRPARRAWRPRGTKIRKRSVRGAADAEWTILTVRAQAFERNGDDSEWFVDTLEDFAALLAYLTASDLEA